MNAKQVAPPFVMPSKQVSNEEPETDHRFGPEDEVDDVATVPVEGLLEAVQELGEASVSAEREQSVVEQTDEQMAGNVDEYWSSGGGSIGGLTLGNTAPQVASSAKRETGMGANPFKPPEANQSNPFAVRKMPMSEPVGELFEVPEGTPSWNEFVKFVLEHGKDITRARYPNPPRNDVMIAEMNRMDRIRRVRGEPEANQQARPCAVIDTVWKGVPVFNEAKCMICHIRYGWAEWSDCQS